MNEERIEVIKIKTSLRDPRGVLIPRGITGHLTMEIANEVATFWFTDSSITRRFAKVVIELEKRRGANDTMFMERFQKIVTKYPGKDRVEIRDLILSQLKEMGANVKNG
jgi:hypothetical protein